MKDSKKHICEEVVNGKPCGRTFRRLDQLRRHQATHSNIGKKKGGHSRRISAVSNVSENTFCIEQSPPIITTKTTAASAPSVER